MMARQVASTETCLEHHNEVSIHDSAEAMGHYDGGALLPQLAHGLLYPVLCQAVQG